MDISRRLFISGVSAVAAAELLPVLPTLPVSAAEAEVVVKPNLNALADVHVRRLLHIVRKHMEEALNQYLFDYAETGTAKLDLTAVKFTLGQIKDAAGIYDYRVIDDELINSPEIVDVDAAVGAVFIKPNRSVNYVTLCGGADPKETGIVADWVARHSNNHI